jgi:hypothetical protein
LKKESTQEFNKEKLNKQTNYCKYKSYPMKKMTESTKNNEKTENIPIDKCIHCHQNKPVKLGECFQCCQQKKPQETSDNIKKIEKVLIGECIHCHQNKPIKLGECFQCYQQKKLPATSELLMNNNEKVSYGECIHCYQKKPIKLGECYNCYQKRCNRFYSSKKECPECKNRITDMNRMINDKICSKCHVKYQKNFDNNNN